MPLILSEKEIEIIKEALEDRAFGSQSAADLLSTLKENEDCTQWLIMTKEEREK